MPQQIFFLLFLVIGSTQASVDPRQNPLPLFTQLLEDSVRGGKPEKLKEMKGFRVNSKGSAAAYTLAFSKDPKFGQVTYWGKVADGRIYEFHLAIHRRGFGDKARTIIEKTLGIKFKEAQWKPSKFINGKERIFLHADKGLLIELKMHHGQMGTREISGVILHVKPVKE